MWYLERPPPGVQERLRGPGERLEAAGQGQEGHHHGLGLLGGLAAVLDLVPGGGREAVGLLLPGGVQGGQVLSLEDRGAVLGLGGGHVSLESGQEVPGGPYGSVTVC